MTSEIKVTVDGIDVIENHKFTALLSAWLQSRGDYTVIMRGFKGATGTVSRAVKDDAATIVVSHERDLRDMAAETLRDAGADMDLTTDHYAALGRAMVSLMRQDEPKPAHAAEGRPNGGLLRRIQAALPETRETHPWFWGGAKKRGMRQCQETLSAIRLLLPRIELGVGDYTEAAWAKPFDIEALKPLDIGHLGFLVMQLAQHLPSGPVDFVNAVIEASKTETPV